MSRIDFPKIYNPANQSKEELINNFVVRTKIFQEIFQDIKNSDSRFPQQPYVIQGIRGQGKTTLLLRLAYEIQNDPELNQHLVPVIFNEEQYNITKLYKLWETTAEYLDENGVTELLAKRTQELELDDDYESKCLELIEQELKKQGKKIILFIDNIDDMFNKFSRHEHQRLREIFTESPEIRVIGASSVSLEFHHDHGKPFYQFFKMPLLRGLSAEETKTLLLKLGERYKSARVKEIVEAQPGRVEALRRLTGGVIRIIVLLFEIFVDDENGNAYADLEKILDSVTPLYKHRMDNLSAQQQEIVDFIALSWDAVSTKEIAAKTKLSSKIISAQLGQLEKYHIIEKVRTGTKNHLYRISERFFNIWYLMRHGRKWDEKRVRFLVEFLQIWCDQGELLKRAEKHLQALKAGKVYEEQALFLTEALVRTPIERQMQHQLLTETKAFLETRQSELQNFLSHSDYELSESVMENIKSGEIDAAVKCLESIRQRTAAENVTLGILYLSSQEDVKMVEDCFLRAIETGDTDTVAISMWAKINHLILRDFEKAEKYYLLAVEKGDAEAMHNLAFLYEREYKDFKRAEKYYLLAVEKGDAGAMNKLALLYEREYKDFEKAEEYYLLAVEKGHAGAMNGLAWLYFQQKKNKTRALELARLSCQKDKNIYNSHTLATILLWHNEIDEAMQLAHGFLNNQEAVEKFREDVSLFLMLLIAKKQNHLANKLFKREDLRLKDRFKPIYYSLMHLMKNEYPNEYRKMGGEMKETVDEIIEKIKQLEEDYA